LQEKQSKRLLSDNEDISNIDRDAAVRAWCFGRLIDWDLTELSAQRKQYRAFENKSRLKPLKLMRKSKKCYCWECENETITTNKSSIWSLQGKLFDAKDIKN